MNMYNHVLMRQIDGGRKEGVNIEKFPINHDMNMEACWPNRSRFTFLKCWQMYMTFSRWGEHESAMFPWRLKTIIWSKLPSKKTPPFLCYKKQKITDGSFWDDLLTYFTHADTLASSKRSCFLQVKGVVQHFGEMICHSAYLLSCQEL